MRHRTAILVHGLLAVALTTPPAVTEASRAAAVPVNARPDAYGGGWSCNRGYQRSNDLCTAVVVPPDAHLSSQGNRWECSRGYEPRGATCAAVQVPRNAYSTWSAGRSGWACERGFAPSDAACSRITLPVGAHLDPSGNDWWCEQPLRREHDRCIPR